MSTDIRQKAFSFRRELLDQLVSPLAGDGDLPLDLSPVLEIPNWEAARLEREQAREKHSEGLMLKRREAPYQVGRKKGDWWKWKVDPYRVDAVLIYAQSGHGRRAGLYTDYTLAVWDKGRLVPFLPILKSDATS